MPNKSSLLKAFNKLSMLAIGGAFIWWFAPYDTFDAIFLFVLGLIFGPEFFGKKPKKTDLSPILDWDEMHEGERFAHFMPEVFLVVFGILMTGLAFETSRLVFNWSLLFVGFILIGGGAFAAREKWRQRYD